MMMMTMTHFL